MADEKKEESLVEYRLSQIEQKLDQVLQLQLQQQALDFRMNTVEACIKSILLDIIILELYLITLTVYALIFF